MLYSTAIMAHISRKDSVDKLLKHLPNAKVSMDDGSIGLLANRIKSLELADGVSEWHLIIQDDAILSKDLDKHINQMVKAFNYDVYSLYLQTNWHRKRYKDKPAIVATNPYMYTGNLRYGVAILIKQKHIKALVKYLKTLPITIQSEDLAIGQWLIDNSITVGYPMPSLVDHQELDSLVGNSKASWRKAVSFIDNV